MFLYNVNSNVMQQAMRNKNMSMAKLGRITGLNRNTLYKAKSQSVVGVSKSTVDTIADALDISFEQLVAVTDDEAVREVETLKEQLSIDEETVALIYEHLRVYFEGRQTDKEVYYG